MIEGELPEGIVEAANPLAPTGTEGPTIMVPVVNPRTERALITLGAILAKDQGGQVLATHIVTVPDQTTLQAAAENRKRIESSSTELLEAAAKGAESLGVPVETRTILSHRGLPEVFTAARTHDVDTVVMGYGGTRFAGGRIEGALEELTRDLPCDFLVLQSEDLELDRVLLPTAGGRSSELSAEVAQAMRDTVGSKITLLHATEPGEIELGREFLADWAAAHNFEEAERIVEAGSPKAVIAEIGDDYDLLVLGATERGLLSRIVTGSLSLVVFENIDASLLLAERPSNRSIWERFLGRQP